MGPHAPDWLPNGNLSIIDNGARRPSHNYTRAVELDPKTNAVVWQWTPMAVKANPSNFYSHYQDARRSCQRQLDADHQQRRSCDRSDQ